MDLGLSGHVHVRIAKWKVVGNDSSNVSPIVYDGFLRDRAGNWRTRLRFQVRVGELVIKAESKGGNNAMFAH